MPTPMPSYPPTLFLGKITALEDKAREGKKKKSWRAKNETLLLLVLPLRLSDCDDIWVADIMGGFFFAAVSLCDDEEEEADEHAQ